jgi:hypothetical protein
MKDMSSDLSIEASAKVTKGVDESNDDIDKIIGYLDQYLPGFADMRVVMDSGALVGQIAKPMDRALGSLASQNARLAY